MTDIQPEEQPTIQDIADAINAHNVEFPTHGENCACMDRHIRELQKQLEPFSTPLEMWVSRDVETVRLTRRLSWVARTAVKGLDR